MALQLIKKWRDQLMLSLMKQDQRPALAHNAASDKMIELANDDKDFDQYEKQAMLAVENKARIDFQSKFLDWVNVLICQPPEICVIPQLYL